MILGALNLKKVLHHVSAFMAANIPNYDPSSPDSPASISKAMQTPHYLDWIKSLMKELMSLVSHEVWYDEPEDLPSDAQAVNPITVMRTKSAFGHLSSRKTRICAQGQHQALDGINTFSPVIKHSSFIPHHPGHRQLLGLGMPTG